MYIKNVDVLWHFLKQPAQRRVIHDVIVYPGTKHEPAHQAEGLHESSRGCCAATPPESSEKASDPEGVVVGIVMWTRESITVADPSGVA